MRLLIVLILFPLFTNAQQIQLLQEMKDVYHSENFLAHFISTEEYSIPEGKRLLQIMLIRHQKVDIEMKGWYTSKQLSDFRINYDHNEIVPIDTMPVDIGKNDVSKIYTSKLYRARRTSEELFGDRFEIDSLSLFNELSPGNVKIPVLYMPAKVWAGVNRFFWLLGSKPDSNHESFRAARKRIDAASKFLQYKAEVETNVVLLAHGYLNREIRHRLQKNGWFLIEHTGNHNLGAGLLVKLVDE